MKQILLLLLLTVGTIELLKAQSFEVMPGTERFFADAQWLRTFDEEKKWSLFSRSRATVDYQNNTNLFTGGYFNYTTKSGFGGTVLGRISSLEAGADAGFHFFKANNSFLIYALASIEIKEELAYSWFSILRFTPRVTQKLKAYSSVELFSNFNRENHVASVQRLRLGIDISNYQTGLGINLSGFGNQYTSTPVNPGVFFRKQF